MIYEITMQGTQINAVSQDQYHAQRPRAVTPPSAIITEASHSMWKRKIKGAAVISI
jgi:hypothetical protein